MTQTNPANVDRDRYFKRTQGSVPNLNYLIGMLSTAIGWDLSCDEKGLAAALRYVATEKDARVWKSSLHIIADSLDHNQRALRLRLVKAKAGRAPATASKGATKDRRSECAHFIFARIALGQPPKAVKADAIAEFGVSQKTIFVWLKHVADIERRTRQTFEGLFDKEGTAFADDRCLTDPFLEWLKKYESRRPEIG